MVDMLIDLLGFALKTVVLLMLLLFLVMLVAGVVAKLAKAHREVMEDGSLEVCNLREKELLRRQSLRSTLLMQGPPLVLPVKKEQAQDAAAPENKPENPPADGEQSAVSGSPAGANLNADVKADVNADVDVKADVKADAENAGAAGASQAETMPTEAVKTEAVKAEAVKAEAVKAEAGNDASAKAPTAEAGETDAGSTEPAAGDKAGAGKAEGDKTEDKAEAEKAEAGKAEGDKVEGDKAEAEKAEAEKAEAKLIAAAALTAKQEKIRQKAVRKQVNNLYEQLVQRDLEERAARITKARDSGEFCPENLYVINFDGDRHASEAEGLKQCVEGLLDLVTPQDEVIVNLKSPGGEVGSYGLCAAQLLRLREKVARLTVCVDEVAASGGYLIACVAHRIVAAPFAAIGSIGVLIELPNFRRFLKAHNIDFELLTSGRYKRTITLFGENTEEHRQKVREQLEGIHAAFKRLVLTYRPHLDMERCATGEYWLAQDAIGLGLIDELSTGAAYLRERLAVTRGAALELRWVIRPKDGLRARLRRLLSAKSWLKALHARLLKEAGRPHVLS